MQIYMKLNVDQVKKLSDRLEKKRRELGLSYTKIAINIDVDQSQVSRICRGEFKTYSSHVMQICILLGIEAVGRSHMISKVDDAKRLRKAVEQFWDGSSEDAERLLKLLQAIGEFRKFAR